MEPKRLKCLNARHSQRLGWLAGICGLVGLVLPAQGQYDPDWARNFRVGALVGFNLKADFKSSGSFNLKSKGPGVYDDGYVHPDLENTSGDNYTSDWGRKDGSIYDSAAQTLTLHKTTSFNANTITPGKEDDSLAFGFDMEYGGYPWRWDRMRLGFNIGFGFLPLNFSQKFNMTGSVTRRTDSFSTDLGTGVPPTFPDVGYHGNPGGEGWNIKSDGVGSEFADTPGATAVETAKLDVTFFAFRVGPTLFFDLHPRVGLAVGAGPAFGLITGDFKVHQRITLDADSPKVNNQASSSVSDFLFGGYVNATLTYHATLNGDFYVGAQYMPLGSASFKERGREAKLDLSGAIFISGGVNWPF